RQFHRREELIPNHVQHRLHVFDAAGDRHDGILVRHDKAILPEGAVAAISIVTTAPELETVTLIPIALWIAAIGRLLPGGHGDPFGWDQLLAVPTALLQVKLAELRNILCAHAQAVTGQRNCLDV